MLIDLTHTIAGDIPVYPGTAAPVLSPACTITRDGFRETALAIGSHTGTHMDAPAHLFRNASGLDQLPISQFCGRAVVLDVSGLEGGVITADFLREQNGTIRSADFVLFYTGWEKRWGADGYLEDGYPVPDEAAARYLVSCGLKGVGTDAVSADRLSGPLTVHTVLLKGGVVILENLCLKKVRGREAFRLFALPLKFENADGAPVRAIAELDDEKE